ncbi:UNVERIFIED_CONTAM: hypothetical protein NCL1_29455 [Trichonephila clavipes]
MQTDLVELFYGKALKYRILIQNNHNSGVPLRYAPRVTPACCVKGILGTGGVIDKLVQMFDKELWRSGPDGSGERREKKDQKKRKVGRGVRERREKGGRKRRTSRVRERERTEGEDRRDGWRKGKESGNWSEKDDEHR